MELGQSGDQAKVCPALAAGPMPRQAPVMKSGFSLETGCIHDASRILSN
jgi:hypothetical protein